MFDGYAERFETHLLHLGYRVPGLIRAALLRHLPVSEPGAATTPMLDLGCGTGLLGVASCDLPLGPWAGVDVSARMLAEAAAKQFYAELHEADLTDWLGAEERRWPVVLAGDVLCYFGALEPVFARIAERLLPGGLLVLSLEEHVPAVDGASPDPGWRLGRQGRYVHTRGHLEAAAEAACLDIRAIDREALRNEAGAPVPGFLAVLARPR